MQSDQVDLALVLEKLEVLRNDMANLSERISALEAAAGESAPSASRPSTEADALSEELVVIISAAIAAYLGKKSRIRHIRLLGGASWAQHGRATIQASHHLSVQHG